MKNEAVLGGTKICVPPTLLVSALGQIEDVRKAVTLDWKEPGDRVYVLGETGDHTGGSEYFRYLGERDGRRAEIGAPAPYVGNRPPTVDPAAQWPVYQALHRAIDAGLVRSAATPAKGGLGICLARCAVGGGLGATLALEGCAPPSLAEDALLFSESNGRFVVTVAQRDADRFESHLGKTQGDLAWLRVGAVTQNPRLVVKLGARTAIDVAIADLGRRFKEGLADA
jgi:phosphoribosylformylglycinamidine synthase